MRITGKKFLIISLSVFNIFVSSPFIAIGYNSYNDTTKVENDFSTAFYAVNDTFYFVTNCINDIFFDDVLKNDVFLDTENIQICYVFAPNDGVLTFGSNGRFTLALPETYSGIIEFSYAICNKNVGEESSEAYVAIIVENDNDCDGTVNRLDVDNDNDGIPDIDEGDGLTDFDNDGLPDNIDIDSDNDGIVDNIEWQKEGKYLRPFESDNNNNGWDDAYDTELNGLYYQSTDTDNNGVPDFLDIDSDEDGILDNMEGFDNDNNGFADISPVYIDDDNDGLDDAYDLISCWSLGCNSIGSNAPLPDLNKNGIRDWRDNEFQVGNFKTSAFEIFIYPNPSQGSFFVYTPFFDENQEMELKLFNLLGIEIYSKNISAVISKINIENNVTGNYILHVISGTKKYQSILNIQ